jgi:hypothetical protein
MTGFADRVIRGAVAFMAAATVAATVTGFWLSYDGLHQFALRAGLRGSEAWAWPASVDLFILAGELGITIAAVSRKKDPMAWVYLLAGFLPSVAFNVLHVDPVALPWGRYAVAAVPPVAAMLALAALMRQVYRLAVEAHQADTRQEIGPAAADLNPVLPQVARDAEEAARIALTASVAASNPLSQRAVMERFGISRTTERKVRAAVLAGSNGHSAEETQPETGDRDVRAQ